MEQTNQETVVEKITLKEINLLILFSWIFYVVVSFILESLQFYFAEDITFLKNIIFSLVIGQISLLAPSLFYFFRKKFVIEQGSFQKQKTALCDFFYIHKIHGKSVFILILFAFVSLPVMGFLNAVTLLFSQNVIQNVMGDVIGSYPLIVSILVIAFLPCVVEEILFRGIIYRSYRTYSVKQAIIFNGIIFGAFHMNFNQFLYAAVMGMVLAMINEATGSILSSIIVHFTINANSVIVQYMNRGEPVSTDTIGNLQSLIFIYGIMSIIAICILYGLFKSLLKIEKRESQWRNQFSTHKNATTLITIPLVIFFISTALIMIALEV